MIRLRILGSTQLRSLRDEEIRSLLAQPKRTALLSYLTVQAPVGFQRRDKLLALFWPELDQEHARAALRQSLHFLRQALGEAEVLETRGAEEVGIALTRMWCDVVAFREAIRQRRWADALDLYRGELLEGLFLRDCPAFESWLEEERENLREAAADAAWALARERMERGELAAAERIGQRALELVGTDEDAVREFIRTLNAAGDRAAAVRFYEKFARGLQEELELEPSDETRALMASIRRAQGPPAPSPDRAPSEPRTGDEPSPSGREGEMSRDRLGRRRPGTHFLLAIAVLVTAAALWRVMPWPGEPRIERIVVLPPDSTGDETRDALLLVVHRSLISSINRRTNLTAPSQASALTFRRGTMTLPEFARALDVDAALEWRARQSTDSIWITASLYAVSPRERPIWQAAFSGPLDNQRRLTRQVAERLAEVAGNR